jgi:hypothetical protein
MFDVHMRRLMWKNHGWMIRHKTTRLLVLKTLLVSAIFLATTAPESRADKMYALPTNREAVDKAVSAENLQVFASKSTDPEVLLGFAFIAPAGSQVRQEISEMAVKGRPEYAPIVTVLAITMDGPDGQSVGELIKSDPDNALGYYLQAHQLYQSGKEKESLAAFRKAATCPELRLYGTITANALFKALDALNLRGRDRLAALSWMAARMSNFYSIDLQSLHTDLSEMTPKADLPTRKEISDLLLILGGHLFSTNFSNRQFAEWSVRDAFQLKAGIAAAEKSPFMNGYVTITQALESAQWGWPDIQERKETSLETAQFLPDRIWGAFAMADASQRNANISIGPEANVPDSDKAAYEKAQQDFIKAATALIDVSLTDPDGIIGSYLKGLPPPGKNAPEPWVSSVTYVDRLMKNRPDVFKAAAANDQAMQALEEAGNSDPGRRNLGRLMSVGSAIWSYAANHNQTSPQSLDVLYKDGKYLKDPSEAQSFLTGKFYIYVAAGVKLPEKQAELDSFILAYDENEQDGCYQCVMGNGSAGDIPASVLKELLRRRSK